MNQIANRTVAEDGTITVEYSFGKVVATPYTKHNDTRYAIRIYTSDGKFALDNYYLDLTPNDEWNLISGIEDAVKSTLMSQRAAYANRVETIDSLLESQKTMTSKTVLRISPK